MDDLQPRWIGLLGLLAFLPLATYAFAIAGSGFATALAVGCVLLVVGSLVVMFSPADGPGVAPSR